MQQSDWLGPKFPAQKFQFESKKKFTTSGIMLARKNF
jgi:hypothetical protein